MAQVSYCEAWEPQQASDATTTSKSVWVSWHLPAWTFGLHHLQESAGFARQATGRDDGCRRQQAAGGNGCMRAFSPFWPLCPAQVLPLLWLNSNDPSIHQGMTQSMILAKIRAGSEWRATPWGVQSAADASCSQISSTFLDKSLSNIFWIQWWSFFEQYEVQAS